MFLTRIRNHYYIRLLNASAYAPEQQFFSIYQNHACFTLFRKAGQISYSAGAIDRNPDIAIAKGISEYIERLVLWGEGYEEPLFRDKAPHYLENIGFAAYPRLLAFRADQKARRRALEDSTEKFCFPEFCQHTSLAFRQEDPENDPLLARVLATDIRKTRYIFPAISGSLSFCICFGYTGEKGMIPGTACRTKPEEAREAAFIEMLRKYVMTLRGLRGELPENPKWLSLMIRNFREGQNIWEPRLQKKSDGMIRLPALEFDQKLPHPFDHDYVVHRALYQGQKSTARNLP